LCCGDLFIWASPNAGNPQKVQCYPREWAAALRRMLTLDAEFLLPGHGFPVIGAGRVRQALTDTADLLDSLVDQTLEVMNAGGRLDDAVHSVRVPAALAERPYLQPVYDEPEFIVHTVWRLYGGWWDGNPATLKPAPERALAAELADLAGGAGALAARALELLELAAADPDPAAGADAAERALRLAGHLAEQAWLADPADPAVQRARQQVFGTRAARATSTMARGVFTWAANESVSESPTPGPGHPH
jgi:alkyl sulfatase BDS1-like metallo-beta-lactamase superfamily hydrolase